MKNLNFAYVQAFCGESENQVVHHTFLLAQPISDFWQTLEMRLKEKFASSIQDFNHTVEIKEYHRQKTEPEDRWETKFSFPAFAEDGDELLVELKHYFAELEYQLRMVDV